MTLSFTTMRFFAVIRQTMNAPSRLRCAQRRKPIDMASHMVALEGIHLASVAKVHESEFVFGE